MGGTSSSLSSSHLPNIPTYAFVDGTNLLCALSKAKMRLPSLRALFNSIDNPHRLVRVYVYTTEEKANNAKKIHGINFFDGCRLVFGRTVGADKKVREKGVDVQLVADLVYHAATKNAGHVVLMANDGDFEFALKRTEDFGCTTKVLWIVEQPCKALQEASDEFSYYVESQLINIFKATKIDT